MSGKDFTPDDLSLDLVDADDGWFKEDETASFAVVCQLTHQLNASVVTPEDGSELPNLAAFSGDALGAEAIRVEAIRALEVLADVGLIGSVEASASSPAAGLVKLQTSYRDTATGELLTTTIPPAVFLGGA